MYRRIDAMAVVALMLLMGCAGRTMPGQRTSSPTHETLASPSPSPSPAAAEALPPLTLEAALDDLAAEWMETAFISAGVGEGQVGIDVCYHCEPVVAPGSFALGQNGTLWIQDRLKNRIAHFSAAGAYLGSTVVADGMDLGGVMTVGEEMYVILDATQGILGHVGAEGIVQTTTVNHSGRALVVGELIGGQTELMALIVDEAQLLGGYWAFATVDPRSGQVTGAPGVQGPDDQYMDVAPDLSGSTWHRTIRWSTGTTVTATREIYFRLVRGGQEAETTAGDTFVQTATRQGVALVVGIGDEQGQPQGTWYLEILADGSGPTFERIPDDDYVSPIRRLAVGPDGSVYRMMVREDGVHILRR